MAPKKAAKAYQRPGEGIEQNRQQALRGHDLSEGAGVHDLSPAQLVLDPM
jgi:hypothetical protein